MKVKYLGDSNLTELINGKVYYVVTVCDYGEKYNIVNEAGAEKPYDVKDFDVVEVIKGTYHGESDPLGLIDGKVYDIVGYDEEENECSVIDESGDDYIYGMDSFEITKE